MTKTKVLIPRKFIPKEYPALIEVEEISPSAKAYRDNTTMLDKIIEQRKTLLSDNDKSKGGWIHVFKKNKEQC